MARHKGVGPKGYLNKEDYKEWEQSVLGIMKRKASKTAFSSAVLAEYQPSDSSMVTVYEDGSVEWVDEIQTERFRDMRQAVRWVQNLVATGRGEWWADDAKKALQWLKRVRVSSTKTSSVEVQLVKLGHIHPELRPHIRPILASLRGLLWHF